MAAKRIKQFQKPFARQQQHPGDRAAVERADFFDHAQIVFVASELFLRIKRVKQDAPDAAHGFDAGHDLIFLPRGLEIRREDDVQHHGLPCPVAREERPGNGLCHRLCGRRHLHRQLRTQQRHSHGQRVRADFPPLARFAAGAEIFDVGGGGNFQSRPVGSIALADRAGEQRRRVFHLGDATDPGQGAGVFHRLPAAGIGEDFFGECDQGIVFRTARGAASRVPDGSATKNWRQAV